MNKYILLPALMYLPLSCLADPDCSDPELQDEMTSAYCDRLDAEYRIIQYNELLEKQLSKNNFETCNSEKFLIAMRKFQESFIEMQLAKCKVKTFCAGEDSNPIDCGMGQSSLEGLCTSKAAGALVDVLKTEDFSNEHCASIPKLTE